MQTLNVINNATEADIKRASNATIASLLNLTFLPIIGFIWLLVISSKTQPDSIDHYHASLGIKLNIMAAVALGVGSSLMIFFGGFDSAWTWVYVICYFTLVHTTFIIVAVWAMIRSWSGQKLRD
ncbi:MAG: hypothetical protein OEX82_02875 [Nitrosomonas sp.]|nr:hypothetical protein [Nitrosomonas sp.]